MNIKKSSTGKRPSLLLWNKYKSFIKNATGGNTQHKEKDIVYWRERLFSNFITYLLPTCLIALVPGVIMSFKNGFLFVGFSDMGAVVSIALISLNSKLNLRFRKVFVAIMLYFLSVVLIVDLSLLGPGILYLLALSIVITVIFPRYWGYWTIVANLLICIFCAVIINFKLFDSPLGTDYTLGVWITVSSNLIFLSLVIVMLINSAIGGLEKTLIKEFTAKAELQKEVALGVKRNELLIESVENYKSLFFQNPSPMWVLDNDSLQFLQVNESAISAYGYTNEEFLTMNIKDIKLEEDMDNMFIDLKKNRETHIPINVIREHRRKNGEHFYTEVIFNSISISGKPATLVIGNEVTEQVNYIKAIENQNENFREIAWIQSHKVRGPLATILGLAQIFNDKDIKVDTEEIVQGILHSSEQLDVVIREIVEKTCVVEIQNIPSNRYTDLLKVIDKNEFLS